MKKIIIFFFVSFFTFQIFSQVGIGTTTPHASSALDIFSDDSGVLIPRIALTSILDTGTITSPETSLLIYNTSTTTGTNAVSPGFYYWSGSFWITLEQDRDWFVRNTTTNATSIQQDIYTQGRVGIGDSTPDFALDVETSSGDTVLNIEADLTGGANTDDQNPIIRMSQDGGNIVGFIEWGGPFSSDGGQNEFSIRTELQNITIDPTVGEIRLIPVDLLSLTARPNGQIRFDQYVTATAYQGTPTSMLGVDNQGNVIQLPVTSPFAASQGTDEIVSLEKNKMINEYGTGELVAGETYINLDSILANQINLKEEYSIQVFIQLEGALTGGVYVTDKSLHGFSVKEIIPENSKNKKIPFSWHLIIMPLN